MAKDNNNAPQQGSILAGKAEQAASEAGPSSPEPADPAPAYEEVASTAAEAPTLSDPFNFPSNAELPAYEARGGSSSSADGDRVIAIPQAVPDPVAPFVQAYPVALLRYGITEDGWRSFLETMSGFLTAKVSDRAISHAGEVAQHLSQGPKAFGKGVMTHAKSVGKGIANDARRGNFIGAAFGLIEGVVSIPVATAVGAAGTALQLPGSALGALSTRPQTPLERASAYAAVANKEWLNARGLQAQLVDSAALARSLGLSVHTLLDLARGAKKDSAAGQLQALQVHISPLQVEEAAILTLAAGSLWMVLVPVSPRDEAS
ncbi:Subunit of the RNA polymerase II mediator complex [Hirsutella rhossiliensis]|uniref:Subunit of the RNA polymerase II mediator complex n=1 Tax=Hirsutella rhossiliensis TaxID=111463 RepID=A0A9P8MMF7_9HYPO|nr:Subunit of the RNA polymerase II mediator complex [Hirsutella rhossiliensis]KAH0958918.1 Subunit of the RNA polymerase II mediator complex [Hirsutella rhossiliensis]